MALSLIAPGLTAGLQGEIVAFRLALARQIRRSIATRKFMACCVSTQAL
jgi:hypothetical protein